MDRLIARLPIEEAEECLCQLEENLITVGVLRSAEQEDLDKELGFAARKCETASGRVSEKPARCRWRTKMTNTQTFEHSHIFPIWPPRDPLTKRCLSQKPTPQLRVGYPIPSTTPAML